VAVTLDQLAQRYGRLPSEVLQTATTFDLEILDIARSYEKYQQNKANGVMPEVKQDVMLEAIKQVRGQ
jgi:hypothetical protein